MAVSVGSVSVDVVPNAEGWVNRLRGQIEGDAATLGQELGRKIGEAAARAIADQIRDGIDDGVRRANPDGEAGNKGRKAGGAFAREFKAEVEAALRALPDIEINADSSDAQRDIAVIREELLSLSRKTIGVDIDAGRALGEVQAIKALLDTIDKDKIDIDFDVNAAQAALGRLEAKIANDIGGSFDRTLREKLRAAVSNLPKVDVDANTDPAQRRLQALRAELEAFSQRNDIDLNINAADAIAEVERLKAELKLLVDGANTDIKIRLDAAAAIAELEAIQRLGSSLDVEVAVQVRNPGSFVAKLRAVVDAAQKALPDIEINANTAQVDVEVQALRTRLATLRATINVDMDAGVVQAEIAAIKAELVALGAGTTNVRVKADVGAAVAELGAVAAAAEAAGAAGENSFSRMKLIVLAVLALLPLIAGAILAIAGAFALIVAPIAAVAVGLNGIKQAIQPLADDFEKIQKAASAAFVTGLAPAVENVQRLMPLLRQDLTETAQTLSQVVTQVTAVGTSAPNLRVIGDSFDRINQIMIALAPGFSILTQNLIDLTNIGLQGMTAFAAQFANVGQQWSDLIARLSASGTAQAAIQALFSVLMSLLGLIGPITELGAVVLAAFGPALAAVFQVVGAAISLFAQALDALPQPLQNIVTIIVTVRLAMLVFGLSFPTAAALMAGFTTATTTLGVAMINFRAILSTIGTAFAASFGSGVIAVGTAAITGLAGAFRLLITALFANPIGLIITGIVVALSFLGNANADAAAKEQEHASAVKSLAQALQESGNVINSNVLSLTKQQLASAETSKSMKTLGLDASAVAQAVASGGPAYDGLIAKLQETANQNISVGRVTTTTTAAHIQQKEAAQQLLGVLAPLRQGFVDAAAQNKALGDALLITGTSMVGGLASAAALEGAIAKLGNSATSTSDKVSALKTALDALNGGQISADQAASKLQADIDALGQKFVDAKAAVKGHADALIAYNGAVNNTTEAGRGLGDQLAKIRDDMIESAARSFDAAGGLTNVGAAGAAAGGEVAKARDAIIQTATKMGLGAAAAQQLADRYQAIPTLVTTILEAKNIPQVLEELNQIQARLLAVPTEKIVNVGVLSDAAIATLQSLNVQITQLPDGTFQILADDKSRPAIAAAVKTVNDTIAKLPITGDPKDVPAAAAAAKGVVESSPPANLHIVGDPHSVPSDTFAAKATVEATPPAKLPITGDATAVPPAAAAARQEVTSVPAELKIVPGSLEFIKAAVADIENLVTTPMNFSLGVYDNATRQIDTIKANALVPLFMPLNVVDAASGTIAGIRAVATEPATFSINVTDLASGTISAIQASASTPQIMAVSIADNASAGINAIRTLATTMATMPIDADTAQAGGKLTTFINTVSGTTAIMKVDTTVDLATGKLKAFVDTVTGTTAILKIDANIDLANGKFDDLVRRIGGTTAVVKVNADTAGAEAAIDNLARPRSTTLTVNVVTNGTVPNASGNIIPAGFSFFANGGFSAMPVGRADIVAPGAMRVIGDRSHDDEAYIPINSSSRSKMLLGITAGRMGYGLVPMARGGLAAGVDSTVDSVLRLAHDLDSSLSTQTTGSFVSPNGTGGSGNGETLAKKLDDVVAAVKQIQPGPGSITVEDRSGDPVATARATQLALRMARR